MAAVEQMIAMKAVISLDKMELNSTRSCLPYVKGMMPNTAMKYRTTLETCLGAVLHSGVTEMSVVSVSGARYFLMFIDEAPGYVSPFYMKTKSEAEELIKRLVKCVERPTGSKGMKLNLNGGREYLKGCTELDADGIDICFTAYYTPEENGCAERMNRIIRNAIRPMLICSGAPANLCAEYLYTLCETINSEARAGHFTTPHEPFSGANQTVAQLRMFGYKVCMRVPEKERKSPRANARRGILLRLLFYGKYRVTMESDRNIFVGWPMPC